ncbi:hypothetical protein SMICM17S_13074 [Streptomyces microflavus]
MRTARARHYLMCRPTYFDVVYSINPWMDPKKPVDTPLAIAQWERLREVYLSLGHTVDTIEPVRGLPDMVFAANGATVVDGRALVARFRDAERIAEGPAYHDWLRANGFPDLRTASVVNEGEGDYLLVGDVLLAGTGFRSDPRSHDEAQEFFGRPVIGLTLGGSDSAHLDVADSEFTDCAVVGVSFGDRSAGRLADCSVEGTRGDGVRHNGLVELVSLRTSLPVVEQDTEPVVPPQTIVNNFNAPVFNAEVHGVQLAWNNNEAVQQQTGEGETPDERP